MRSNEDVKLKDCTAKLQTLCEENNLECAFLCSSYPIKLIIKPCADMDGQTRMTDDAAADDGAGYISADASITLYVRDGEMGERIEGTFDVRDALKSKIKNLFKQMHYLYLQLFQRMMIVQKGTITILHQNSADSDANDSAGEYDQDEME